MSLKYSPHDHTAAFAAAFLIANLLFVGIFYIALWILYLTRFKKTIPVAKNHLKQALIVSSISTGIFLLINIIILLTSGYASLSALIALETYYMLIVPVFLIIGILAFIRAVTKQDFKYPVISRFINFEE
jgi:hypothetical protein